MLKTRMRFVTCGIVGFIGVLAASTQLLAQTRPVLSFYGTNGLIDMPTAQSQPDGQLSLTTSFFGPTLRNTLSFQIAPRLSGSFRYSRISGFDAGGTLDRYDRSFDISYQLADETRTRPALVVGLQDFGGTGTLGAEYLVATKRLAPRLRGSAGLGWGRFGSYNGFENPLAIFSDRFRTRPTGSGVISDVGRVEFGRWFRGDAAFFGGLEWQVSDRLSFAAEYSSDAYVKEDARGLMARKSPFNFGFSYRSPGGFDLGLYYLYGSEVGVLASYSLNPKTPPAPGGIGTAPPPVYARSNAAASWDTGWTENPADNAQIRDRVAAGLASQGLALEALALTRTTARLRLRNDLYDAEAQAIGRAARSLTQTLPPSVETITIVPVVNGLGLSAVTLRRSDLEALEAAPDGAWQSYVRAEIGEAVPSAAPRGDVAKGAYPRVSNRLRGYFAPSLFDPDNPLRADVGAELGFSYAPGPGVVFSGALRQPVLGNLGDSSRVSNSVLPHVRSDAALYSAEADLEVSYLTGEYFFRPGRNLYGRVTGGYLEQMYGGVSAELLWKPVNSRAAFGAELNYVRQREFDQLFGFRSYDVVTGHVSAYYDFGNGYLGQVDAGRYLAGDWGATFSLDREFRNGWRVGAFFTLTDVSFEDFGEGSFDKGIRIQVPLSWLTGTPARRGFSTTIRPLTRDGGARLNLRNRLYELTRGYHDQRLANRWARFWR